MDYSEKSSLVKNRIGNADLETQNPGTSSREREQGKRGQLQR